MEPVTATLIIGALTAAVTIGGWIALHYFTLRREEIARSRVAARADYCSAGQMALGPKTKNACSAAKVIKSAMRVYSIALPRCPFFFKRRKYSKVEGLRLIVFDKLALPMTGVLFTAMPPLRV